MRVFWIIFTVALVVGPVLYLAIWGPVGRGQIGPKDRDLSAWGNPDRDRVPGSRRRY